MHFKLKRYLLERVTTLGENMGFKHHMAPLLKRNIELARNFWGTLSDTTLEMLSGLTQRYGLLVSAGDLILLDGRWYVTHSGLLGVARRKRCAGIQVRPAIEFSNPSASRWAFEATVYTCRSCRGFVGYGDADPSNVSPLVRGAEMRVAETRAVNRALRKAYGIGICSIEELGSISGGTHSSRELKQANKRTPQPVNRNSSNCNGTGIATGNGSRVRDRLCQLIRQHSLDAELVKAYTVDFCGTKTLREATREQVENFVVHLADWAEKDRNALLCQLNSYSRPQAGAA
jgi:hypothetical protein